MRSGCAIQFLLTEGLFLFLLFSFFFSEIISDIGTSLFYQVCGAMDDNVMNYQPTVQFFTSCVEVLGKVSK